ncbi:Paxillin 1, partial [Fusarium albosuccineum]
MAVPRESVFLPTIKCSSCGRQVEISLMGEHICSPPEPELSPPPEQYEPYTPYNPAAPPEKHGRVPPSLDVNAANQPFMRQGQLTPNSEPLSLSPHSKMEGFFDAVPTPHEDDLILPSPRPIERPGVYGGFGEKKHGPDFQPRSVSPNGGVNTTLMSRLDTIAPGPFDTIRSPSATSPSFPKEITDSGAKHDDYLSASPKDIYIFNNTETLSTSPVSNAGSVPPRRPTRDDYEGFGRPSLTDGELQPQPLGLINRSETFPKSSFRPERPLRTPSAPGTKPERSNTEFVPGHVSRPSMGPDTSRPPPPRKSLLRPHHSSKYSASVDLAAEFGINNPYHTPSDSTSSGYSTFSRQSHGSSQTSQTRSQLRRDPSDVSTMDGLMSDLETSMESLTSKDPRMDPPVQA